MTTNKIDCCDQWLHDLKTYMEAKDCWYYQSPDPEDGISSLVCPQDDTSARQIDEVDENCRFNNGQSDNALIS